MVIWRLSSFYPIADFSKWHPKLPMSSARACRKGKATEYSVWEGFVDHVWARFCHFCSVSMEESSVTWPHLTGRVAGEYGVAMCQGIGEDAFGELLASLHLKRKRGKDRCWRRTLYSIFLFVRKETNESLFQWCGGDMSLWKVKREKKTHRICNVCWSLWCK